ncbi:uncharacterized protein [Ptychodera flava]|uniref:uncharacterized protein n=1 Tax=Ptychodera flava TaxID=63121 RepID=UPI003969F5DE
MQNCSAHLTNLAAILSPLTWCTLIMIITFVGPVTLTEIDFCDGKEYYDKYTGCLCGKQFAKRIKLKDSELKAQSDNATPHFEIIKARKTRRYVCVPCTICEDGVIKVAPCWENQDTMCRSEHCADPNMYYDVGTRSCQPKENLTPEPSDKKGTENVLTPTNRTAFQPEAEVGQAYEGPETTFPLFKVLIVVVCVCSIVITGVVSALAAIGLWKCLSRRRHSSGYADGRSTATLNSNGMEMADFSGSRTYKFEDGEKLSTKSDNV